MAVDRYTIDIILGGIEKSIPGKEQHSLTSSKLEPIVGST
jgi:hypothetical protein